MKDIGRNDPCPCGSGKKYKHCCLGKPVNVLPFPGGYRQDDASPPARTFMEQAGTPNAATEVLHEMQQALAGRSFSSKEELDAAISALNQKRNSQPLPDFLGLSSERMHAIIQNDFEACGHIVKLQPEAVDNETLLEVPYVRMTLYLLSYLKEKGSAKATAKLGHFPRALVRAFYDNVYREYDFYTRKISNEDDIPLLCVLRTLLTLSGLIKKQKGSFSLTAKGTKFASTSAPADLYRLLFLTYCNKIDWLYRTGYDEPMRHLQSSCIFDLLILKKEAKKFASFSHLAGFFLTAFPMVLEGMSSHIYYTGKEQVSDCFNYCFLDRFALQFGLIEQDKPEKKNLRKQQCSRTTALFDAVLRWQTPI